MHERDFSALESGLLAGGISQDYARRAAEELAEHYEDLLAELASPHVCQSEADAEAANRLGDLKALEQQFVTNYLQRRWYYRWPKLGSVILPVACLAALPLAPVAAGMRHADMLFRWSICILLGGTFTAVLFAAMHFSIHGS